MRRGGGAVLRSENNAKAEVSMATSLRAVLRCRRRTRGRRRLAMRMPKARRSAIARPVAAAAPRLQGARHHRRHAGARHRRRGDAQSRLPPAGRRRSASFWRRARCSCSSNLAGDGERLRTTLERGWRIEDEERTYPMPRRDSHAWFAVAGRGARRRCSPRSAPSICAMTSFADLAIAQTSVARCSTPSCCAPISGRARSSTCLPTAPRPLTSWIVCAMPLASSGRVTDLVGLRGMAEA